MDRNRHNFQRVYYQRLSSDRFRQRRGDRGKLLGKVQDRISDAHGHRSDLKFPASRIPDVGDSADLYRSDTDGSIACRLCNEK